MDQQCSNLVKSQSEIPVKKIQQQKNEDRKNKINPSVIQRIMIQDGFPIWHCQCPEYFTRPDSQPHPGHTTKSPGA